MRAAWRLEGLQLYANVIKEIYKSAEPQRDSLCTAGSQTYAVMDEREVVLMVPDMALAQAHGGDLVPRR